jgi:hypothetical protein
MSHYVRRYISGSPLAPFGVDLYTAVHETRHESTIADEAKRFVSVVEKEQGSPVCINGLINKAAANVICSIVFGKRFEYDDEKE